MTKSEMVIKNQEMFLKNPLKTKLGKEIVSTGIELMYEKGFESFTFKKLAKQIDSTEASIYRYFENKHKLLFYLVSWYWSIIKYRIDLETINLPEPVDQLKKVINILFASISKKNEDNFIDESKLAKLVVSEFQRCYLSDNVEKDYNNGLFESYKNLCHKIAGIIKMYNPGYKHPKMLSVLLIRMVHKPIYFSQHLPEMIDINFQPDNQTEVKEFVENIIISTLK